MNTKYAFTLLPIKHLNHSLYRGVIVSILMLINLGCKPQDSNKNPTQSIEAVIAESPTKPFIISGQATYRERILLPPEAKLTVKLLDISIADTKALKVSEYTQTINSSPPFSFDLTYDANLIATNKRYSLQARITINDKLLMITDTALNPFKQDSAIVLQLKAVTHYADLNQTKTTPSSTSIPLQGEWQLASFQEQNFTRSENSTIPFLAFNTETQRVNGFSGCNHFNGRYQSDKHTLNFSPFAMTRKLCSKQMSTEMLFMQSLEKTVYYKKEKEVLLLLDNKKSTLATFKKHNN